MSFLDSSVREWWCWWSVTRDCWLTRQEGGIVNITSFPACTAECGLEGGGGRTHHSHMLQERWKESLLHSCYLLFSLYISQSLCVCRQRQSNWKINRIRQRIFSIMFIFSWTQWKKCKFSISIIFASTLVKSHKKYIYKKTSVITVSAWIASVGISLNNAAVSLRGVATC